MAYTRQKNAEIQNGLLIDANDLKSEFDAIAVATASLQNQLTGSAVITGARTYESSVTVNGAFNFHVAGNGVGLNEIKVTLSTAPSAYEAGMRYLFQVPALPLLGTTPMLFLLNNLPSKSIKTNTGEALLASDLTAGKLLEVTYDGADFISNIQKPTRQLAVPEPTYVGDTTFTMLFNRGTITRVNRLGQPVIIAQDAVAKTINLGTVGLNGISAGAITAGFTYHTYLAFAPATGANGVLCVHDNGGAGNDLTTITISGVVFNLYQIPFSFIIVNDAGLKVFPFDFEHWGEQRSTFKYRMIYNNTNVSQKTNASFNFSGGKTVISGATFIPVGADYVNLHYSGSQFHRMLFFSHNDAYQVGHDTYVGGGQFVTGIPLNANRNWQQQWTSLGAGSGSSNTAVSGYTIIL